MPQDTLEGFQLSSQQLRLWTLSQRAGGVAPVSTASVAIDGVVQLPTLKQAVQNIMSTQEILATSFQRLPGMSVPLQIVGEVAFEWAQVADLAGESPERQDQQLAVLRQAVADATSQNPSLHIAVARLADDRHRLILAVPTLQLDRSSLDHFVDLLGATYASLRSNEPFEPELLQYIDFASWQQDLLAANEHPSAGEYWQQLPYAAAPVDAAGADLGVYLVGLCLPFRGVHRFV